MRTAIGSQLDLPELATPQSSKAWRTGLPSPEQPSSQPPCKTSPPTEENICLTEEGHPITAACAEPLQPVSGPSQLSVSCWAQPKLYIMSIHTISSTFCAINSLPVRGDHLSGLELTRSLIFVVIPMDAILTEPSSCAANTFGDVVKHRSCVSTVSS